MILVIDNYDSFVYNLARYLEELGEHTRVVRNDSISLTEMLASQPEAVVLSPGPGRPEDAGISVSLVREAPSTLPILGVCLGHQCIAEAFGGITEMADRPVHGKLSAVHHLAGDIFTGIPTPFNVTRYHSLTVPREALPEPLMPLAWTADDTLMAMRHRDRPYWGLQFHPEALLTEHGHAILSNFLSLARGLPPRGTEAQLPDREVAESAAIGKRL